MQSGGCGGEVAQSCLTLATPRTVACQAPLSMDSPGKNAGVVVIPFFRVSSQPRD